MGKQEDDRIFFSNFCWFCRAEGDFVSIFKNEHELTLWKLQDQTQEDEIFQSARMSIFLSGSRGVKMCAASNAETVLEHAISTKKVQKMKVIFICNKATNPNTSSSISFIRFPYSSLFPAPLCLWPLFIWVRFGESELTLKDTLPVLVQLYLEAFQSNLTSTRDHRGVWVQNLAQGNHSSVMREEKSQGPTWISNPLFKGLQNWMK